MNRHGWADDAHTPARNKFKACVMAGARSCRTRTGTDMFDRFMHKVDASWGPPGSCWEWRGARNEKGYGWFSIARKQRKAHRVSYEMFVRPIPVGLEIDHLCGNRGCVRPDHLEAVSHTVNLLRGNTISRNNANKTECVNGHAYTADNTYNRGKWRECRTCRRAQMVRFYDNKHKKTTEVPSVI